ncbi:hypothetical protein SMACR_04203 [Sordaria macrospora]|uniref:WGS project CABT00000000 data, contig 2.15 n=3 Tax=Sordaria macrospora TaxID=5147 RepID=F7VZM6_SORMK|nr:uncharacterized protein SMAC_04203 [Sordaria macrospora k-hell]KAA8629628.1 hypothetical protein SMACR_04203 [Sordaria macrospora]KAH7636050.1 hypothetical protein B0T09DRAFT_252402 [Sordaria sp. MPI-SDFR-AT-0083]CCC10974.1 unnamed protein product [Sordaria macrospora k-hell]
MGGHWGWEMAALLLSCCSLVATITVLKLYDGTNVNSWKFYLSLSTTLSILSQVSRTSTAFALTSCIGQAKWNWFSKREDHLTTFTWFDAASRGPLGSVALFEPYSDVISAEQILYGLGRKTPGIEAIWLNNPKGKLVLERLSSLDSLFSLTAGKVIADRRETFYFRDAFTTFIVFQILKPPRNYTLQVSAWKDEPPEAWECGFSFCLNRYNSTVQDGILYETVLNSTKQTSPESMRAHPHINDNHMRNITNGTEQWYFWSYPSNYSLYSPLGDELSANLTLPNPSKLWDFARSSLDLQIPDSWETLSYAGNSSYYPYRNDSRTFSIGDSTVRSTIYWFLDKYRMFVGTAPCLAYNGLKSYNDNDVMGKSIAQSTNITETFENTAKRMTAFMLEIPQTADNEQVYVNGQAFVWVEHIRIRWPFVTFPVAVAVAGLVFVLLTTEGVANKVSEQTVVTLSMDSADGSFELKESKESASSTGALLERYASSSETLTNRYRDEREGM